MEIKQRGSHLDHLLRQTRMHHTQLSAMADMKANILLTMASVVITLSVRYIAEPHLKWATTVLIAFCLMTIGLATYVVMPKIPFSLKTGPEVKVRSPWFNLLFFGDFVRLTYEEFEAAMEEIMNDPNRAYQVQKEVSLSQAGIHHLYHWGFCQCTGGSFFRGSGLMTFPA
jgi:hypothetical protein